MSNTPIEYARVDGAVDTGALPGKYYVGWNVERLCGSALLTGISSQLSPCSTDQYPHETPPGAYNVQSYHCDSLACLNVVTGRISSQELNVFFNKKTIK
jgi:hypothetical protein